MNRFFSLVLFFCLIYGSVFSQQLIRESLSSVGSSYSADGFLFRQTVGQSSNTNIFISEEIGLRQGFQQPIKFNKEAKTFKPEIKLNIYPNPVSDNFTINIKGTQVRYNIYVSDITGRHIKEYNLESNTDVNINCEDWNPGMYFISIITNNELLASKKIIKSKY